MRDLTPEEKRSLARAALEARERAYCPYSRFSVGAALLCGDGAVVTGCNIENAAHAPGSCAERTAFVKAVSEGRRDFDAIAVAGGRAGREPEDHCAPCGVCRQVMAEFCGPDFTVLLVRAEDDVRAYTLEQLLPAAFGPMGGREALS